MNTIFAKLLYELEKHNDAMLVTIISEQGSAPRGTGSQMLVGATGRIIGTIGGGAVEHRSEQMAMELLNKKQSGLHEFKLHKNAAEDIGMVCGGDVTVYFQYINHENIEWTTLAQSIIAQVSNRKKGWFLQHLDGSLPTLLGEGGELICGSELGDSTDLCGDKSICARGYFSMPLPIGERAIIFGGGHITLALAPLLKSVGFRVTVMDNRQEYANPGRFPDAEEVICGNFLRISDYIKLNKEDYVVVMTNGHSHDFEVQEQVLRQELAYVGVIGSRSKTAAVNAKLSDKGIPYEVLKKVHTPIGTPIKAVTPEEIAVSIAGEMILVRAERREAAGGEEKHGCPMH
jgi:xanthine dehydrogenase accessory factor